MPVDYDVIANAIVEADKETAVTAVKEYLETLKQEVNILRKRLSFLMKVEQNQDLIMILPGTIALQGKLMYLCVLIINNGTII